MSKVFFGVFWPGGVIFINLISPISILSKDKEILILLSIFPQQPIEQREQHMEQSMFGCIEVLNKDEEENVVAGQERHRVRTQVITRLRVRAGAKICYNFMKYVGKKRASNMDKNYPIEAPCATAHGLILGRMWETVAHSSQRETGSWKFPRTPVPGPGNGKRSVIRFWFKCRANIARLNGKKFNIFQVIENGYKSINSHLRNWFYNLANIGFNIRCEKFLS